MTQHSPEHWGLREEISLLLAREGEARGKPAERGVCGWDGSPMVQEIRGTGKGALNSSKERRV